MRLGEKYNNNNNKNNQSAAATAVPVTLGIRVSIPLKDAAAVEQLDCCISDLVDKDPALPDIRRSSVPA